MNVPQFGIFAQGTIAHEFIEFDLRPDVDPLPPVGRSGGSGHRPSRPAA